MSDSAASKPAATPRKPRWGDECEVRFERLDKRGNAVGTWGEYQVHERGAGLGARVRARVISRRKQDIQVQTLEVLEAGRDSVAPRCRHSGRCGGCTLQDLAYSAQLEAKASVARAILTDAGLATALEPILPCLEPWHYRNKMDFTFGPKRWVDRERGEQDPQAGEPVVALGLHPRGFHSKILETQECAIAFEGAAAIVNSARRLARELGLDAYDSYSHAGVLRHLVLRRSWASGEILAVLVTRAAAEERVDAYVQALLSAHPEISSLVQLINTGRAVVATGESERTHHGSGKITEELGGSSFEIGWQTFFQTNTPQAERLLDVVLEAAAARAGERIHDLYCGTGSITLALAKRAPALDAAPNVLGIELVESAIDAARSAAERNGVANVQFLAGDVLTVWREQQQLAPADLLVVDPPRAGVHPKVLAALAEARARCIVLVSCQLESGARDAAVLVAAGWRLTRVQAIDLFPHTPHLECVLRLERKL
jgi:23S rRNA (uracil1939-C5)-methyltransferase